MNAQFSIPTAEKIVTNEIMISFYFCSDMTITNKVPHNKVIQGPWPEKRKEDPPQANHGLIHLCNQIAFFSGCLDEEVIDFRLDADYISVIISLWPYNVILGYTEYYGVYLIHTSSRSFPWHNRDLGLCIYVFQDQKEKLFWGNYWELLECINKSTMHRTIEKPPWKMNRRQSKSCLEELANIWVCKFF